MKPIAAAALLALVAGCTAPPDTATPSAEVGAWGVDLTTVDATVAPGDDFYRHVNGAWLDRFEIPPDKTRFGAFDAVRDVAELRVREIVEDLAGAARAPGSVEQKIGDYYRSYLDVEAVEAAGLRPLAEELAAIAAIETLDDLVGAFGRSDLERSSAPIGLYLSIDRKNPDRYLVSVGHAGLGLPERDFYLDPSERFAEIRAAYAEHIATMLTFTGHADPTDAAAAIVALETRLAAEHWPRSDRINRDLTYNLHTLDALQAAFDGLDWRRLLAAAGAVPDELNVMHPSAMAPIITIINATPIATWRDYLTYHLVSNNAFMLTRAIDDANFAFFGTTLYGQPEQRERWKRGISLVGGPQGLGDAIGRIYVERHFPPEARAAMEALVGNLLRAFRERIERLDWMGDTTRAEALAKLDAFRTKIGYPDRWRDFSAVTIAPDDLAGNVKRLRRFWHDYQIALLGKPTDRDEWWWTPQTVNAGYLAQFNEIIFPAAILQPPFFDPAADPAVNYGAIGAVIGHEIGHGFDDQGSKSDGAGIQRNWWTAADRARFEARAERLVEQYSGYEPVPGTHIDGAFTLGENIGDLGGLIVAHAAYALHLDGREAPVLDGYTGDQRFFLAFAQLWRAKDREARRLALLKSDPHAPARYRAWTVRNVDAWYEAFDVGPEHELYLAPDQRVSIW